MSGGAFVRRARRSPSRLKTVLDVGKAATGVYPAMVPAHSMWRPSPTTTPTDVPKPKPYAGPEPKPSPKWYTLQRTGPFRAYVDEELGMGTSVEFTPLIDGSMEAVVTPNTGGGMLGMLSAWFYQSQWYFSGPAGEEDAHKIVLPSGDILLPEFVQYADGDMYLKSYGYLGKEDGSVVYIERRADSTYKPKEDTTNGAEGTKWGVRPVLHSRGDGLHQLAADRGCEHSLHTGAGRKQGAVPGAQTRTSTAKACARKARGGISKRR